MFYLIVGVEKCGTTSLCRHFNLHPQISCFDEYNFFSKNKNYSHGIEKYMKTIKNKKPIYGDKSPSYFCIIKAIDRIYENFPYVKLIIMLREPISRLYSSFNFMYEIYKKQINRDFTFNNIVNTYYTGKEIENVEDLFMNDNNTNYEKININDEIPKWTSINMGFYINYIEYIYSKFPKENIYICIQEEFLKNPLEEYNKLYKFLGAKELTQEEFNFDTTINKGNYKEPISDEDFKYTYNIYKEYNEKLYKFLGRRIESWDEIYQKYGLI